MTVRLIVMPNCLKKTRHPMTKLVDLKTSVVELTAPCWLEKRESKTRPEVELTGRSNSTVPL